LTGELVFIGLGLNDEHGFSLRGQAEAKSCHVVFAEFYTNTMPNLSIENLSKIVEAKIRVLSRSDVEDQGESAILQEAKNRKVGLLVPGDPMVATTHVDLRLRAEKAGIRTRIVHAASVASAAAGEVGLQSYKFGRTVTVPAASGGSLPESVYVGIKGNVEAGLHSLILLEVDVENRRFITIPLALKLLLDFSKRAGGVIREDTLVVGLARLESPDMLVKAGPISEIARTDFGPPPYCMIIPGKLHFMEAEALRMLAGATSVKED